MSNSASRPVVLESGDRLTRAEFHRRYCLRPDIKKAELVEGVVYVRGPVSFTFHAQQHGLAAQWLVAYSMHRPGVRTGLSSTTLLEENTEVQPDAILFRDPPPPGGARVNAEDYIEGPPQLVVEVAASSASYDLHDKLHAYRRAGVQEYIVWRVLDGAIDWLRLHEGDYQRIEANERGIIESTSFPGLRLDVARLLAGDAAGVLTALG